MSSIHRLLRALRAAGFDGASLPVGVEDDGRERLVFIEGDVAVPPYPAWAQTDDALASATMLIRRFHDAAAAFDVEGTTWSREMADPSGSVPERASGGWTVCHNDVCLENVVFRDGVAVALLDFDFAAPGRPVYDLAQFARMCVPVDDERNNTALGWEPAERPRRLRLVADAYGLDNADRGNLLGALSWLMANVGEFVRRRVEAGDPNFTKMWNDLGGAARYDRRRRWWDEHRHAFAAALR